jgi:hypothetical protein
LKTTKRCSCVMHPRLQQTGWHWPHANWHCPICYKKYWQKDGESITDEQPAVWPQKTVEKSLVDSASHI